MSRWMGVALASCVACGASSSTAPPPSQPYVAARDPLYGPLLVQAAQAFVSETCFESAPPGSTPGSVGTQAAPTMHTVDLGGGIQVQQHCGLVANEVFATAFENDFVAKVCAITDGQVTTECAAKFMDMFMARLSERYTGADWNAISVWCRAYPLECKDSFKLEREVLASHNAGVKRWYDAAAASALSNAQAQQMQQAFLYQQARAADAQERAAAVEEKRERLERIRAIWGVHCASTSTGTTVNTTCR